MPGAAAQAIGRLIDRGVERLGAEARARAAATRTLDQHFDELFQRYEAITDRAARAA